jgi:hypothetical protein
VDGTKYSKSATANQTGRWYWQVTVDSLGHKVLEQIPVGSWVRKPPGSWLAVCCECRVLSSRGLYVGLISRPEEFNRLRCIVRVCSRSLMN